MRHMLFSSLLLALLAGCSKTASVLPSLYVGSWELRSTAGMTGPRQYPAGNGDLLEFSNDSLIRKLQGQRVLAIHYQVVRDTTYFFGSGRLMDKVIDQDPGVQMVNFFVERRGDTLMQYYGSPSIDGGSTTYVRVR